MSRYQLPAVAFVVCMMVPVVAHTNDLTALIPGDTYGYVVINRLADADDKIQKMGRRMNLPIPSLMQRLSRQGGFSAGVEDSRAIALAFLPTADGPTAALYVPVNDYPAFVEQLEPTGTDDGITAASFVGQPVIVGHKRRHAVVTWPSNRPLLSAVLSDSTPQHNATAAVREVVDEHDVAAVVTSSGVNTLVALAKDGLENLKDALRENVEDDSPALAGIEVYVHILNAIDSEVDSAALGLEIGDGGSLRLKERVWVQSSGKLAPIIRTVAPHHGDLLSGLPNIPFVFVGGGAMPSGAFQTLMDFSGAMMKGMPQLYGLSSEQVDEMMKLSLKYFPDLDSMAFLLGVGRENAPLYSEMLGAMQVRDAGTYLSNYRKFWAEFDEVIGDAEDSFLKDVAVEDVDVGGVPALRITMPIPAMHGLNLPNQADIDDLMEKLYGPGGIVVYLAAAGDHTVFMAYTDTALLSEALQSAKDETKWISQEQQIIRTAKQLPSGAQAIGYWSPGGASMFANRMMQLFSGSESSVRLPAFPPSPPVGWAMTVGPEVITFDTVLPAKTIEAAATFIERIRQIDVAGADN